MNSEHLNDDLEDLEETPGIGHNSGDDPDDGEVKARDLLRKYVERIENLNEEKDVLAKDIREVFAEAKAAGFDTRCLREVLRLRQQDKTEREEQAHITATYMLALGMVD